MKTFQKVEGQWIVPETTELFGLTIFPGASLEAPEGKTLVMTVNGESVAPAPGNYEGDIVLEVLDPIPNGNYQFRAAIYAEGGTVIEEKSALSAVIDGEVKDGECLDVSITSRDENFNGICVCGKGPYTVSGADVSLMGNGGNDFIGYGAGIMTTGDADVVVKDARIHVEGAIRSAVWCGGESHLKVEDSVIDSKDADPFDNDFRSLSVPMMKCVPFALGLDGNCRATNVLEAGQVSYENSIVVAEKWAPLSTDSGYPPTSLTVKNVLAGVGSLEEAVPGKEYTATKTVAGKTWGYTMGGSGYVAYGDGGVTNLFEDCQFYSPDYILICTGVKPMTFKNVTAKAGRAGFMWHQAQGGNLTVEGGSYDFDKCGFQIKSGAYVHIDVKDADIKLGKNGVLIQQLESDDAGGIITRKYVVPMQEDDWSTVAPAEREIPDSTAVFTGETLTGDIYNSVYGAKHGLSVTLKHSSLTGVVSSSYANHLKADGTVAPGGTVFEQDNHWDAKTTADYHVVDDKAYLYAGRLKNTAAPAVNNPVSLTLEDGAVWTVTGTSYLKNLTISQDSKVCGTITVDGKGVSGAGTYTGEIVVKP